MADVSQIKLPNGSVYDLIDEKSGYITAEYIENKTDYEIPVSRVGEIVVGETAIGTDSTNFPTSKAVVDYVDERVVQEMDAIDVGVTGIKANGTSLAVENGVVNIPAYDDYTGQTGLFTQEVGQAFGQYVESVRSEIPTSISELDNDSGFITASDIPAETDPTVPAWAKASTKPTYTANEVGALPSSTVIPSKTSDLTNDSGYLTASDIASVMTYKGTKANYAALPSTGNTTGDVWHLTDTGAEWAWDGSVWQELGTAIDLSGYATKATTLAGYGITDAKIQNGTITLGSNTITPLTSFTETDPTVPSWAKQSSKPTYGLTEISGTDDLRAIEALTGTSGLLKKTAANTWTLDTNTYLTSYTETDPVFSASAAAGITATDISNWNAKVSDDKTWNGVTLNKDQAFGGNFYVPKVDTMTATTAYYIYVTSNPSSGKIPHYDDNAYLYSTTPSANDNSTKVATTAYVDNAIPKVYSSTNTGGYLTMATLPIYDGTVE